MELLLALIGWALIVTAGYFIGKNKGREVAGVILAALLGLIGLVIVACLPRRGREDGGAGAGAAAVRHPAGRGGLVSAASRLLLSSAAGSGRTRPQPVGTSAAAVVAARTWDAGFARPASPRHGLPGRPPVVRPSFRDPRSGRGARPAG